MTKKEMKEKLTIKDLEKIMLDNFIDEYKKNLDTLHKRTCQLWWK